MYWRQFDLMHPTSDIKFSSTFKMACDNIAIHERAATWIVLHHKKAMTAAALIAKLSLEPGYFKNLWKAYLCPTVTLNITGLSQAFFDDFIGEANDHELCILQLPNKAVLHFEDGLRMKMPNFGKNKVGRCLKRRFKRSNWCCFDILWKHSKLVVDMC